MPNATRASGQHMNKLVAACLIVFAVVACGDSAGPYGRDIRLTIVSGDEQLGLQYTVLPETLVVEVVNPTGQAVAGAQLSFSPRPGSGRVLDADSVTDESGRAQFRWELGEAYRNEITVSLVEDPTASVTGSALARYLYVPPEQVGDGWEPSSLSAVGMDVERFAIMMDQIRSGLYEEVHSVVVVKDGKLVFEQYFPGHDFGYSDAEFHGDWIQFDRNTRHNTHSATKSVVSSLVGIAIDRGLIVDEHQPVFSFFDEYASLNVGGKEAITIEHLLQMASGLEWHEWDAPIGTGQNSIEMFNSSANPTRYVLSQPLLHEPGTVFNYNGGTVNILCRIVEKAAGERVDQFADDHLFGPMGVSNYNFPIHRTGDVVCHGDIYITPRDMAKFGYMFLNGGVWQGQRILSQAWIDKSVAPHISVRNFHLGWAEDYGYLWWLREYAVGGDTYPAFKALGWGGQEIWVLPESDMVVVFTGANYTRTPPCDELMTSFVLPAMGGAEGN
jgi:CubicO group peptidase (beta-lactamase class C family)